MSKKSASEIVSGAGFVSGFITDLVSAVKARGGSDEDLYRLVQPEGRSVIDQIADLVVTAKKSARTLAEMIAACKFDYANPNIIEQNFPLEKMGTPSQEAELVHYGRTMKTEAVHADLAKRGMRPANLLEQIIWCQKNPELQRQFPIVALRSDWRDADGDLDVPVLGGGGGERELNLRWDNPSNEWYAVYRFLAVRK